MRRCAWLCVCVCVVLLDTCLTHSLFTCEPVQVQYCHNMPYNMTFFPNMLKHYDQDIAASEMQVGLYLNTGCVCVYSALSKPVLGSEQLGYCLSCRMSLIGHLSSLGVTETVKG